MKLWIRIDAALRSDPNVAELASRLGIGIAEAAGCCVLTWCAIAEHCPDGDVSRLSPAALTAMSGYVKPKGRPPLNVNRGEFAFADVFLDLFVSDGRVKGWHDRQGKLIERAEKERARKFRGSGAENLGNSAPTERNGTEQQTSSVADGCVPEPARLALRQIIGTATNPTAAAHEIKAYADGLRAPLCPTPDQLGRAVLDFAANGSGWNAGYFRAYVKRAITEDAPKPARKIAGGDDADFVRASEKLQALVSKRDPLHSHTLTQDGWALLDAKERASLKVIGGIERVLTAKSNEWQWVVRDFLKAQRGAAA